MRTIGACEMNSRAKGKRGELEWAAYCRHQGYGSCRRTAQYCGNTGDASDVVGLPGIHQEVKRVEALNIEKAMAQAIHDSRGLTVPMVAHRKNGQDWLVTMRADDWFAFYHWWAIHQHGDAFTEKHEGAAE